MASSNKYVILFTGVGTHFRGELVEIGKEAKEIGVDVEELLHIGAIRKATSADEGEVVPWGQGALAGPKPFPVVPFDATPPTEVAEVPAESK